MLTKTGKLMDNKTGKLIGNKIIVHQSKTADTRTCDVSKVSKGQLKASSVQHIGDIKKGLDFFKGMLDSAADVHDFDKLTKLDGFYKDFKNDFKTTSWWDNHRSVNRHHLGKADGVPKDVNLVDVIEYVTDCVMAGKARSGKVTDVNISNNVLMDAFNNTVKLLISKVEVA